MSVTTPRLAVITNPKAGGNRRAGRNRRAVLTAMAGPDAFVCEPASLEELADAAQEIRRREIEVLAVCGGDGSYFRTLSAVVDAFNDKPLPALLPLRGGSMNTIARAVGHRRGTPEGVLGMLMAHWASGGEAARTSRQLIRVNDVHLGFLTGCGAVVRFLEQYYARPGRGPLAAVRVTGSAVLSALSGGAMTRGMFEEFQARVVSDGQPLALERFRVVFAATIAEFGLGFRVAHRADREPGRFHLLAGRPRPSELAPRLLHLKKGWPLQLESLHDATAREVVIDFEQPEPVMVDGDILDAVPRLTLAAGPRIEIILPP